MRTNVNLLRNALTVLSVCCVPGFSDDRTLDAIRNKAQAESRVMDDAFFLSDVYGPRFLASPSSHDAADWVKKRLEQMIDADAVEAIGLRHRSAHGFRVLGKPGDQPSHLGQVLMIRRGFTGLQDAAF